jgi:hypothetical protein
VSAVTNFFSCVVSFLQTYNGAVTAVATVFIGVFTWVLACVTNRQARLTRESIELGRQEFLASHRPQLKIHFVRILPFLHEIAPDRQSLKAECGIINIGTSEGTVTGSAVYLEYLFPVDRPYLPEAARNDVIKQRRFGVGATDKCVVSGDNLSGAHHVSNTTKALYLYGWIVYEDGRKNVRTTYFCRQYLHDKERFAAVDDPDCEQTY